MTALVALILMAAQDCGSADLNSPHDPPMTPGQPMGLSISRAVLTEDIRHLKPTRGSHPFSGLRKRLSGSIERRSDLGQV